MIDAVETSSRQVDKWRDNYSSRSKWHIALISGVLGVLLGAGLLWWLQNSRIDKYQVAISQTNAMAGYINSDCKIKQSYAKFVGDSITCDKEWASPSSILGRKNESLLTKKSVCFFKIKCRMPTENIFYKGSDNEKNDI